MSLTKPQRIQITAPNPIGAGYFKHGQYAYVVSTDDTGGKYCIDTTGGPSRKGQTVYLVSKTKEMRGGALWLTSKAFRLTGRK